MTEAAEGYCQFPHLDELAPDFEAVTTCGRMQLSDLRGGWLLFFSYAADFSPVCASELASLARHYEDFRRRTVALLGLSVGGIPAHIAWLRSVEQSFGVKIPFPVVADLDMRVSCLYGLLQPVASAISAARASFIIDDKGIIRAMQFYPVSNGRSIVELLRLIDALQATDQYGVATGMDWHPGDAVLLPAPATLEEAGEHVPVPGEQHVDWYYRLHQLPPERSREAEG